jgi:hypothetical protein
VIPCICLLQFWWNIGRLEKRDIKGKVNETETTDSSGKKVTDWSVKDIDRASGACGTCTIVVVQALVVDMVDSWFLSVGLNARIVGNWCRQRVLGDRVSSCLSCTC